MMGSFLQLMAMVLIFFMPFLGHAEPLDLQCNFELIRSVAHEPQVVREVLKEIQEAYQRLMPEESTETFYNKVLNRARNFIHHNFSRHSFGEELLFIEETVPLHSFRSHPSDQITAALGLFIGSPVQPNQNQQPMQKHRLVKITQDDGRFTTGYILTHEPLVVLERHQETTDPEIPPNYFLSRLKREKILNIEILQPDLNERMSVYELQSLAAQDPRIKIIGVATLSQNRQNHSESSTDRLNNYRSDSIRVVANLEGSLHLGWWRPLVGHYESGYPDVFLTTLSSGETWRVRIQSVPDHESPEFLRGVRPTEALRHTQQGDLVWACHDQRLVYGSIGWSSGPSGDAVLTAIEGRSESLYPDDAMMPKFPVVISRNHLVASGVFPDPQGVVYHFLRFFYSNEAQEYRWDPQSLSVDLIADHQGSILRFTRNISSDLDRNRILIELRNNDYLGIRATLIVVDSVAREHSHHTQAQVTEVLS